ncbi:hypothetical protein CALVIDRAFT_569314 [Calocera viscosa TUFC12733]|uniref:DNA-directed RNA polymerase subunit n=1 Tax=Calocera viscosa (strain TUFC12733) TaxID=1330018 RepID=A0A167G4B9_CALVF|nr:hypothetical protein CALVIDRAFT_569314 [Calocera viscosa TUFC12733]
MSGESIQFCTECNNLLYPRADEERKVLMYACRNCDFEYQATDPCVYKNDLFTVTKEQAGVTEDVNKDITLPRDSEASCPRCHHDGGVTFQDQGKRKETRMTLFYVCLQCGHAYVDPGVPQ